MQREIASGPISSLTPRQDKRVRRAGLRAQGAVAMLGDGNTCAGDDQRRQRRDIVGAGAVAAGSDDVDRVGRRLDGQHACPHGADRADDLVHRLAAYPQRHQEAADLRRRCFTGHDDLEGGAGILAVERLARCGLGDEGLQIRHAMLSFALPLLRQRDLGELLVDRHTVAASAGR